MKRLFKCALALSLVLLLAIPVGIRAAGTLTVTTVSGEKGEQVAVEVCLTGDDVCSGNFDVRFDHAKLQLVEAQKGDGNWFGAVNEKDDGVVKVSFAQTTPLTEAVLCRLIFKVTADTPADGTKVTLANVRLYNEASTAVDSTLVFGSVSRDCVWFTLKDAETVEGQGVRAEIYMSGTQLPCGGNFAITYDSDLLQATGVLALDGLKDSQMTYHLEEGIVRIAFAGELPVDGGALCVVIFRAVGNAGSTAELELTEVRAYDENSKAMDTEVSSGQVQVVVPTEADPKLWLVGGALNEDGTAIASIVFQGRKIACGGQCTLLYDSTMSVDIQAEAGVEYRQEPGKIHISWAKETPSDGAETLVTVAFSDAIESALTFADNVRVYDENSVRIEVVDIRPGAITATESVHVTVDSVAVETAEDGSAVSINIDLADADFFTEAPVSTLTPMLAIYKDGKLVGIDVAPVSELENGVAEVSLTATANKEITDYAVFVTGGSFAPLCSAITGS